MTDGTEHAIEFVTAGILFCMAIVMLLWLHNAFVQQTRILGTVPNRTILFEQEGV